MQARKLGWAPYTICIYTNHCSDVQVKVIKIDIQSLLHGQEARVAGVGITAAGFQVLETLHYDFVTSSFSSSSLEDLRVLIDLSGLSNSLSSLASVLEKMDKSLEYFLTGRGMRILGDWKIICSMFYIIKLL